ncbi:hypothetical protein K461DRAFT_56731 [Myriangium duriaei CBS 260.36]|uniref:Rhodopsin domain-containing protein n=1 Tax=Myriangium duriaei CBS 260.36 TaxID=1168546 RepID=A0A9P4IV75_9PEZI|nr:hypothetical protein K461DRAFT_56731 [Myriangium duriaei CBS 260.36]
MSSTTKEPNVHADTLVANAAIGFAVATVFLALRLYVRTVMTKFFGYDDWVLIAAFITFCVLTTTQLAYGIIVRGEGLVNNFNQASAWLTWHTFFYAVDQAFLKAALAAFYLRVLRKNSWQRKVVIGATAIFFAYTMILAFVFLFQCGNPLNVESEDCLPSEPLLITSYLQAALNASMDWLLTLLPITVVFGTEMTQRTKISVCAIMLLGVAASVISIVRIFSLHTSDVDGLDSYITLTKLMILSYWENAIGQIAIAMAALRPLLRLVVGKAGYSSNGESKTTGGISKVTAAMKTQQSQIAVKTTYEVQTNGSFEEMELITRPKQEV